MQIETTFDDAITWKEEENPFHILKHSIQKDVKRIALEPSTPFEIYDKLQRQFPSSDFLDGGSIINKLRSRKNEDEIERMKLAAKNTVQGVLEAVELLKEDQTEIELLKLAQEKMATLSGENSWALVQFDEHSAIPHGHPSNKKLKQNSVVLIDAGTTCEHYFADITFTTVFGKASEEFLKIYEIVEAANEAALIASKEGVPAENVDFAAREVIEKAGYGKYFTHRLGHGLGLQVHEEPYIVKGNKQPLMSGNVHTDEPGIYQPGKFGIRIEDDIYIDKIGKRLVSFDRHIWS